MKNFIIGKDDVIKEIDIEFLNSLKDNEMVAEAKFFENACYYGFLDVYKEHMWDIESHYEKNFLDGDLASLDKSVELYERSVGESEKESEEIIEVEEKEPFKYEPKECNAGMFVSEGNEGNDRAIILFHRVTLVIGNRVYVEEFGNEKCIMLSDKDINNFWVKFCGVKYV